MTKIVADENIPLVDHYFGQCGELVLKPGRHIVRHDLLDADLLLVRSVTRVDRELLQRTPVKFVGTTTIGVDHIDTQWLDEAGIGWAVATGCNSTAVVEYVMSVIAALQRQGWLTQKNVRAGVIGVGRIGSQVVKVLNLLGFEVVQCDPLRAEKEENFISTSLEHFSDLDFITLHTPLTRIGQYKTHHLINKDFLCRQKPGCVLLNTGRGAVVDFSALKLYGNALHWCFDVWESEPEVDLDVLKNTVIATPHIAGYSVQSKYRGIEMIYQAVLRQKVIDDHAVSVIPYPKKMLSFDNARVDWRDVMLRVYDPMQTSQHMKEALLQQKETFDHLRKHFVERYELAYVVLQNVELISSPVIKFLGL